MLIQVLRLLPTGALYLQSYNKYYNIEHTVWTHGHEIVIIIKKIQYTR